MAHNWLAACPECGRVGEKKEMRPLFTAETRYAPPRILCYLCQSCFCRLLDKWEIPER